MYRRYSVFHLSLYIYRYNHEFWVWKLTTCYQNVKKIPMNHIFSFHAETLPINVNGRVAS